MAVVSEAAVPQLESEGAESTASTEASNTAQRELTEAPPNQTMMSAGLAPQVKAIAEAARKRKAQEAETVTVSDTVSEQPAVPAAEEAASTAPEKDKAAKNDKKSKKRRRKRKIDHAAKTLLSPERLKGQGGKKGERTLPARHTTVVDFPTMEGAGVDDGWFVNTSSELKAVEEPKGRSLR